MIRRALCVFAGLLLLIGCSGPGGSLPPLESGPVGEYTLDTGDQLRVIVFGQPDLSGQFGVNDRGEVSMPLLGQVAARGLTTPELESEIESVLSDGFLVNPSVSVEVGTFRPYYILGQVEGPGRYEFAPGMTILTAVTIAGGFTFRANEDTMSITRYGPEGPVEYQAGRETAVQPGDVIFVFERYL